jgi:alkanesulfonate monooxygenase SsuD/methylene tetrahydromethanopterin reductase-like flavin-dependent oxidoreductase (luciferase family)
MIMVGLRYDLRVPPFGNATHEDLYRACLDQAAYGEEHGFHTVVLSEHHGVSDGYMSAPLTLAAAIAGRTRRIMINIAAALVPLHDPVRFAEQVATIQLVSGGRLSFVAGAGYRAEEFEMAGIERKQRGRLLEEYVGVMRKAWSGEPGDGRDGELHGDGVEDRRGNGHAGKRPGRVNGAWYGDGALRGDDGGVHGDGGDGVNRRHGHGHGDAEREQDVRGGAGGAGGGDGV